MNNLQIVQEEQENELVLTCSGRLDANSATQLNDHVDRLLRDGVYQIGLKLDGVEYLSSAGIRSLVNQHKNLKTVNGCFYIISMSENVRQVLTMVGMADMLAKAPLSKTEQRKPDQLDGLHQEHGFNFLVSKIDEKNTSNLELYGKPELVLTSGFTSSNARVVEANLKHFGLGLGAIDNNFESAQNRFGEFVMMGKNIAYLPSDGSRKPDYMYSSGQLVATICELYGLHFDANFSHAIRFESETTKSTIGLSVLTETLSDMLQLDAYVMVMLAESGGLIGTSLNKAPVGGEKLFTFPEIKNTVNFTTEPVHHKKLLVSVGVFAKKPSNGLERFTRKLDPEKQAQGHFHAAVFPFMPMKKTDIDLCETIDYLFNYSELNDIMHLTNDKREISGLGESQFSHGFCWLSPFTI
ncbi:MAG: STAS domain-containing protein [Prolixibacteraceae bacterium]|jgi:anti-anti-sigma factor|nr:STAS domain-containing protein [Prolixibacteraceae bacterium]